MKLSRRQLRKLIKESAIDSFLEEPTIDAEKYDKLTAKDNYILDVGPSHPDYHRVFRKAERLGPNYVGAGTSKTDFTYDDVLSAQYRAGAYKEFLKMIETDRGRAAINEPMIALGMDPSDGMQRDSYKAFLAAAMAVEPYFDKILQFDNKLSDFLLSDEYIESNNPGSGDYNPSLAAYVARKKRKLRDAKFEFLRSVINDFRIVDDAMRFSVPQMKKVLQVQAKALRPMPAYTPSESETQLAQAGVDVENLRETRNVYRRNKMKFNRKKLRKMIMEELLQERVMMYDDGTDSLTKPKEAAMSIINKIADMIVQQSQDDMASGRPVAFGSFNKEEVMKIIAKNLHKAFLGGMAPELQQNLKQQYKQIDPENYAILENERSVSPPTLMYALGSILKDLGVAPVAGPYSFDNLGDPSKIMR